MTPNSASNFDWQTDEPDPAARGAPKRPPSTASAGTPSVAERKQRTAPSEHLTELDDGCLAELAQEWRTRALQGEKAAYGPAQAFEAEMRRRERDRDPEQLPPAQALLPVRPWWRFW